ncbi:hypothetical protein V495_06868 [Pseudogymnoascus sp. VKM F-4514 (FW-929)]|nr:hypothetical protein V495_06868 [Pseudogymnoascus sp. VKM F-4514 (FW-929)]KFY64797.1 hypothetical protein V497_01586 [Pseudogymnoascus sp. VKM F-4516 (FW-969)]
MSSEQKSQNKAPSGSVDSGITLINPHRKISWSDQANVKHIENATRRTSSGQTLRNEDSELFPEEGNGEGLQSAPTQETQHSQKSKEELQHESHISNLRESVGLPDELPIAEQHEETEHFNWPTFRLIFREPLAEFFGTFVLLLFGNGSVAQVLLSGRQASAPGGDGYGSYQSINWGWGVGIFFGIYIAGDSGGFLNPAVTLGFCLFRGLPWRRFPIYFLAQFLGGFVASGVVYANYINAIDQFEGHGIRTVAPSPTATASIFCTYPQPFLSKTSQFFSEFIASAILMFAVFALKDDSNPGAMGKTGAGALFPLGLFFLIFGLGISFGWDTGYAINLARDFGPRLMSYILGYGPGVWSAGGYYFWIPVVAPFCGCVFGGFLYDAFIYTGPESPLNKKWWGLKELYENSRRHQESKRLEKSRYEA